MFNGNKAKPEGKIPLLGWILFVFIIGDVISAILLTTSNPRWQTYVYLMSSFLAAGMIAIMLVFLKRDDYISAGIIATIEQSFRGFIAAFVYKDLGIPMQLLTLVLSAIIVLEWLPRTYMRKILPVVMTAGLLMLALDIFGPSWRIEGAIPPGYRFVIVGFIILIFCIYAIINFRSYGLMVKLILILLGLSTVTVISVSVTSNILASRSTINDSYLNLQSTALDLDKTIDSFLTFTLKNIEADAVVPEIAEYLNNTRSMKPNEDLKNSILQLMYQFTGRNPIFIDSYALLDQYGMDMLDTNTNDIGTDYSEELFFSKPKVTDSAYISPIQVTSNNRYGYINFSMPVHDTNNKIIGVIRVRYDAKIFQSFVVKTNNQMGKNSFGILFDEKGIILAHGSDPSLIRSKINNFGLQESTLQSSNGTFFLEGLLPTGEVQIDGFGSVVSMQSMPWKIAYFQPNDYFLASIKRQTNYMVLLAEAIAIIVVIVGVIGAQTMTAPLLRLTDTTRQLAEGNLQARADITSEDEFGLLAATLNTMSNQLYVTRSNLEKRIKERTQAIEKAAQVNRVLSLTLDTESLIKEVSYELQKAFNYYHVQIYLLNSQEKNLVLVGGTGNAADILLRQGHTIPFGRGLIGQAALNGTTLSISNTALDPNWIPNPLLPETRSELAVPIVLGDEILGILDVQQNFVQALGPQDEVLLELIARQVAVSLRNARQYERARDQVALQEKIGMILDKLSATTSIHEAIQVALKELSLNTGSTTSAAKWTVKL